MLVKISLWVGFSIWAVVAGWFILRASPTSYFDPEKTVETGYLTTNQYLSEFTQELQKGELFSLIESTPKLIRITSTGCGCNLASNAHWQSLKNKFTSTSFLEINYKKLPVSLARFVPSTPMAIYLDDHSNIKYAGPFSVGLSCSQNNSLVDIYLINKYAPSIFPFGAKGCYCNER